MNYNSFFNTHQSRILLARTLSDLIHTRMRCNNHKDKGLSFKHLNGELIPHKYNQLIQGDGN